MIEWNESATDGDQTIKSINYIILYYIHSNTYIFIFKFLDTVNERKNNFDF